MQRLLICAALMVTFLVVGLGLQAGQPDKKVAIPDKKELDVAESFINGIFKEEIAKAQTAEAREKLATYLLQQGDMSSDDPPTRYVLYRQARDLAVLAGNPALTFSTIDKLAQNFNVAGLGLKVEALGKLVNHVSTKEPSKALTELALPLIAEALAADNYETASALGKVATAAATKSQDVALIKNVIKRTSEIESAKEKFSVLQPYLDRLKKNPDDGEANLKLEEYFGLYKGKWDRALAHLAKSPASPLAELAKRDLAGPKEAQAQLALADAWWDFAAKEAAVQQERLQERAAVWYGKAMPSLTGFSHTRALRRVEAVSTRFVPGAAPAVDGLVGFIRVLEGHDKEVKGLAISADGRLGLSGSADKTMRLWDLAKGKELQIFRHNDQVWGVAFVPNSNHVISASWDRTAKLWDMNTGQMVHAFNHPQDVNGMAVSKDGFWMVTSCDDKHMRLWDLKKKVEVKKFPPHTNFCYSSAIAPNGTHAASGSMDRTAQVYELATGKVVRDFQQANSVLGLAFSADSKYLFTCGDNSVHMWDIATGNEVKKFETPQGFALCLAMLPDGKRLISGGEDQLLHIWDIATGRKAEEFKGHTKTISAVAVSSDGWRALTGQTDGTIRYWGLPAAKALPVAGG